LSPRRRTPRCPLFLCFYSYSYHRRLHSFPTRRSSDLWAVGCRLVTGVTASLPVRAKQQLTACLQNETPRSHPVPDRQPALGCARSEEHTSELQSRENLVCRLLLEEKKEQDRGVQLTQL